MDDSDSLKLGNQLCFAVYSAAHAFNAAYKPFLEPLGLTYPQYLVLMVLWEEDGLMVHEIGRRLHLDSGTLTPMLKRLEAAGFVKRKRDKQDERQVRIQLTDKARNARPTALEARRAVVCALGDSENEIQKLKQAVDQLHTMLRNAA
jgi:DNA-binding MarR family transcriptional regulator